MSVEITQFREYKKNTLQGFATVRLTGVGLEIRDITVHSKNSSGWLGLPAKPFEKDGKTQWMPLVKFYEKARWDEFQEETLKALDEYKRK
ncbi:MAG: hypothetical protein ACYTEL_00520 [Planctomycetota bacterium]|jgi:hypothetical protein